jgi:hypothetical protein
MTAQFNEVEELRGMHALCAWKWFLSESFLNLNCKTSLPGFFFMSPELFRALCFLTHVPPATKQQRRSGSVLKVRL